MSPLRCKIKGYFMLFRVLPVMVWAVTGTLVGTSLASMKNYEINWPAFLLVLLISALVQGYPTHIINEIYDWKSGADPQDLRAKKSGGSKVLQAQLLSIGDLWWAFVISNLILAGLVYWCIKVIDIKAFYFFFLPAYFSALFYTLPPFRFAYRPFLGEWLGGFAGMFVLVVGSYYVQTFSVNLYVILSAVGFGIIFIGIMIFFHYLDYENDQQAVPVKKTTVVYLGLEGSRKYVYFCLVVSFVILGITVLKYEFKLIPLLVLCSAVGFGHSRIDLNDPSTIIRWGKFVTMVTLAASLVLAGLAQPILLLMTLPISVSYWAHKKFGKLKTVSVQKRKE
ncbi:MAG: prenyltransferase [bacterium]